jgi:hypothetical protein
MEEREIFEMIVKADEALKYATAEKAAPRAKRARELLLKAREEARAAGIEGLISLADQRLLDLESLDKGTEASGP